MPAKKKKNKVETPAKLRQRERANTPHPKKKANEKTKKNEKTKSE